MEFSIDLKWSLWSQEPEWWTEHDADSALEAMREAFAGRTEPVTIHTAPRKEIRYGKVTVREGEADVRFYTLWDSPSSLIPDHVNAGQHLIDQGNGMYTITPEYKAIEETVASYFDEGYGYADGDPDDPIGAEIEETVKAGTFEELLAAVDQCEAELIEANEKSSNNFDDYLKLMFPEPAAPEASK